MIDSIPSARYDLEGNLGSFWVDHLRGDAMFVARVLSGLAKRTSCIETLISCARNMAGEKQAFRSAFTLRYKSSSVAVMGPDVRQRIKQRVSIAGAPMELLRRPAFGNYEFPQSGHVGLRSDGDSDGDVMLTTETDEFLFFPSSGEILVDPSQSEWLRRYLVPIPFDLTVISIRTIKGEELVTGLNFTQGPGVIALSQHPDELFECGGIYIVSALQKQAHLLDYPMAVEPFCGSAAPLSNYARASQSAAQFLRALGTACDFVLAPQDGVVLAVKRSVAGYHYQFHFGEITIDYPHVVLEAGDAVNAGDIIGQPIQIHHARTNGDTGWWRMLSWADGISLDYACPFRGLTVLNENRLAYATEETDDVHARFALEGPTDVQDRFWYAVKRNELLTGKYLNAVIGLADLNDTKSVNPMQIFFDYLWADKAWVITRYNLIDWGGARRQRMEQFISNYKPFSGIILFRDIS